MPATAPPSDPTAGRVVARIGVRLLLCWVAIVVCVVGAGELLTGPLAGSIGVGDNQVERWLAAHRSRPLTDLADGLSLLGETWTVVLLGPLLLLATWLWLRALRAVLFVALALVGELAEYLVTVSVVSRARPPVRLLDPGLDPQHSYPSGHVGAATAMYGAMAVLVWLRYRDRRRLLTATLACLPLLVAVARLYLGAHHPTDVLASLVLMSAWLAVLTRVLLRPTGQVTPVRVVRS
jgi:membrane-associated phospholipid phosphatase